ncbi:hypothetical protein GCM10009678_86470 [Actinomadura kijaniata]|uniref:Uncharacterized protein n=1 Tax=Actinomadura namibiensis TaxID=182080 RepID=A0A7W3M0I1_ACTNM|nr:hypothetical protein [Actinomadura namibiensis]MBA8957736.1 hypothetical protein [Actinomadura namibiensis]
MLAVTRIDLPDVVWALLTAAAVLAAVVALPMLAGGRARTRGGRRGDRIRIGPGLPALLGWATLRRWDSLLLAAATITVVAAVLLNARA